jgi:hypothetical protein
MKYAFETLKKIKMICISDKHSSLLCGRISKGEKGLIKLNSDEELEVLDMIYGSAGDEKVPTYKTTFFLHQ